MYTLYGFRAQSVVNSTMSGLPIATVQNVTVNPDGCANINLKFKDYKEKIHEYIFYDRDGMVKLWSCRANQR